MIGGIVETLLDEGIPIQDIERLLNAFGGLPLYIPKSLDPNHPIAAEAGTVLAETLSAIYGGTQPVIPTGEELHRQRISLEVRGLAKKGHNAHEIVRECRADGHKLHLRQVYRILSRMDAADRPPKEDPRQQYLPMP